MKKTFLLIALLLNAVSFSMAQCNYIEAHLIKNDTIGRYLAKRFSEIIKRKKTDACVSSTIYAEFEVNTKGEVVDTAFFYYGRDYVVFKDILSEVILSTKGFGCLQCLTAPRYKVNHSSCHSFMKWKQDAI